MVALIGYLLPLGVGREGLLHGVVTVIIKVLFSCSAARG